MYPFYYASQFFVPVRRNSRTPRQLLVPGNTGTRSWCDFKEDGTCSIGGTTGTYSVSDDMVLTMTPKSGDKQDFEWAGSKDKVTTDNWFIVDDTLYVNGGVYPRIVADDSSSAAATASSDSSASSN